MREKISHVIIKLHGKKVHTYDQIFHMYYKISHACQKVHICV